MNTLRIDKYLWHIRLFKSRSLAKAAVQAEHVRINSKRVENAHKQVVVGDIITLPRGEDVVAIRILSIPSSRRPAKEAQACYLIL